MGSIRFRAATGHEWRGLFRGASRGPRRGSDGRSRRAPTAAGARQGRRAGPSSWAMGHPHDRATRREIRDASRAGRRRSSAGHRSGGGMANRAQIPPGPGGGLLLGNTLPYMRDPLGFLARAVRDHGDVVRLRLGNTTTYVLTHPGHIEDVLRIHHQNFIKDKLTRLLIPILGRGLLTSEGDFWRRQRRLSQTAFLQQQDLRYGRVMVGHTERMLSAWGDGRERHVHEAMMQLTLGIVAKVLFDAELTDEVHEVWS